MNPEEKFYVEEKSKLLSKSLLWDSEACDFTEIFGHHNSSLCTMRANVQCMLKKVISSNFFLWNGGNDPPLFVEYDALKFVISYNLPLEEWIYTTI